MDVPNKTNYWLKSEGVLGVTSNAVRLIVSMDFVKYYKSLIDKEYRIFSNLPAHGSHVTLFQPKIHGNLDPVKAKFLKNYYKKNKISFEYNPQIIQGGFTKDFRNWYVWIRSIELNNILTHLNASPGNGLHLTICNTKGGVRPYIWLK